MEATMIAALVVAIPVILFPVALIWYVNIGGIILMVREKKGARAKQALAEKVNA